jgi:Ca2+-binding RTX toxin-like protein
MISDEAALAGDADVRISDGYVANVGQPAGTPALPANAEITVTGLTPGNGITYRADAAGDLTEGISYWLGWGSDHVVIDGTHQRGDGSIFGTRTVTSLNLGLGNDVATVDLDGDIDNDGFFVLSGQGLYDAYLTLADDDVVDGSTSTRSLLLFGGQGSDTLRGGSADDLIFGDRARIQFVNETGAVVSTYGFGGQGDYTDGIERQRTLAFTVDHAVGGADTLYGNAGFDVLVGGTRGDRIDGGSQDDLILGDNGTLDRRTTWLDYRDARFRTFAGAMYDIYGAPQIDAAWRLRPGASPVWADYQATLADHDFATESGHPELYGNDYIAGGLHNDVIFGQLGNDTIQGDGSIDFASQQYRIDPVTGALVPVAGSALGDVGAYRDAAGLLLVRPSFEHVSDGDDYIEGNGGNDTVFGGLGQDDIIGGSSGFFGLADRLQRTDGSDLLFGGAGARIGRNDAALPAGTVTVPLAAADLHGRDSDTIIGDNGRILRAVTLVSATSTAYRTFGYDNYGGIKVIPRATVLLDYTLGGSDINAASAALDIGAADEVHGESGDDSIHGMLGFDVLFGDGQDDDLIGGTGSDWISGGTGDDGILGDDGRILTSRNGTAEPLYGLAAVTNLNAYISTPGKMQEATINVAGQLKKTAILEPFNLGADDYVTPGSVLSNDIVFGGLGNDAIHGGAGDDALSGAEALPQYFAKPFNPGNYLQWGVYRAGEFAAYDEYNPMAKIWVDPSTGLFTAAGTAGAVQFILNFVDAEADGADAIFGDLGNDWLVGGRDRDHLYGGWGDDLHNADDLLDTAGGLNNAPDTDPSYEDLAFGGAGRDILIANTGGDRLIDWAGEFNSYIVPFAPFGLATISRALQPQVPEFLYALAASDGADPTRATKTGAAAVRNGEPFGELGLIRQQDFAWRDQTGAPDDPQPGNIPGGRRDVLRSATFDTGLADGFMADSGRWRVTGGRFEVSPTSLGGDAVSVFSVPDALPTYFELTATINVNKPLAGAKANTYLIFDYQSPTNFKFAGVNIATNKLEMGYRNASGWNVVVQANIQAKPSTDYNMLLAVNGVTVTLVVNNISVFSYAFAPRVVDGYSFGLNNGFVGVGTDNASGTIDNVRVQILPPAITLERSDDFNDGTDDVMGASVQGLWSLATGLLKVAGATPAFRTVDLDLGTNSYFLLQTKVQTGNLAGIIFDYYGPNDYKFAGINVATKQVVIAHQTKRGWTVDATSALATLNATTAYTLEVSLKGTTVSVAIDGQARLGFVYNAPLADGQAGVYAATSASFDSFLLKTDDPKFRAPASGSSLLAAFAPQAALQADSISTRELGWAVEVAISLFATQGVSAEALNTLRNVEVAIGQLDGLALGWTDGSRVIIDHNAAGFGWSTGTTRSMATDRFDLLSVIMHEFGHVLGQDHAVQGSPMDEFMSETLAPNTRVLPGTELSELSGDRAAALRYLEIRSFAPSANEPTAPGWLTPFKVSYLESPLLRSLDSPSDAPNGFGGFLS